MGEPPNSVCPVGAWEAGIQSTFRAQILSLIPNPKVWALSDGQVANSPPPLGLGRGGPIRLRVPMGGVLASRRSFKGIRTPQSRTHGVKGLWSHSKRSVTK